MGRATVDDELEPELAADDVDDVDDDDPDDEDVVAEVEQPASAARGRMQIARPRRAVRV